MEKNNSFDVGVKRPQITVRDLIDTGVFTALIFLICMLIMPIGFIPILMPLYCVLIPWAAGIPWMVFSVRVKHFGPVLLMSLLLGILLFVTGMGYLGAPLIVIAGLIADLVARSGGYKSFKKTVISNGFMSLWVCANYFPILVTADSYRKSLIEGGFSAEYADSLFRAINTKTIAVLVIVCFIFGMIGAVLGKKAVKKHFEKAGIV